MKKTKVQKTQKILVIPDIHLHIELVEWVSHLLEAHPDWRPLSLGDWFDDWNAKIEDYEKFIAVWKNFLSRHRDILLCWGNHDYGYYRNPRHHSGYNGLAQGEVNRFLHWAYTANDSLMFPAIVIPQGRTLFSHAGITRPMVQQYFDRGLDMDTTLKNWLEELEPEALWENYSPLWHRPTNRPRINSFNPMWLQVVGHTSVPTITYNKDDNILYTDTWSTDSNGTPLGDKSLVVVDTDSQTWEVIPYEPAS